MKVTLNHAGNGDCILIESENSSVLIDGGTASSYSTWKNNILKMRKLDAVIVTHIDSDHVNGIIKLLDDVNTPEIGQVLYNGAEQILGFESTNHICSEDEKLDSLQARLTNINNETKIGTSEATSLSYLLRSKNINRNSLAIHNAMNDKFQIGDYSISILSPTLESLERLKFKWLDVLEEEGIKRKLINKSHSSSFETYVSQLHETYIENISSDEYVNIESLANYEYERDNSINNETSIALLIEHDGKKILEMGDCHAEVIVSWLNENRIDVLDLDAIKLSHHGSKKNITSEFLNRVNCNKFLISTDGSKFKHPNLETIAIISEHFPTSTIIINEHVKHIHQNFIDSLYEKNNTTLLLGVKEINL